MILTVLTILTANMTKKTKKHPWDETVVVVVMIVSALCILLLIAGHMNILGKAYSSLPTEAGVMEMLSQCQLKAGEGITRCSLECGRAGQSCILSWEDQTIKRCNDRISGAYSCLCCSGP